MATIEEILAELEPSTEAHPDEPDEDREEQSMVDSILSKYDQPLIVEDDPHDTGAVEDEDDTPTPRQRERADPTEAAIRAFEVSDLDTAAVKAKAAIPKMEARIEELDAQLREGARAGARGEAVDKEALQSARDELARTINERKYVVGRAEFAGLDAEALATKQQSLTHQLYEAESAYTRTVAEETERRQGRFTQRGQAANARQDPRALEARANLQAIQAEVARVGQELHRRANLDGSFAKSVDKWAEKIVAREYDVESKELESELRKGGAGADKIRAAQKIRALPANQQEDFDQRMERARKEAAPKVQAARSAVLFGRPKQAPRAVDELGDKGARMRAKSAGNPFKQQHDMESDLEKVRARVQRDNQRGR